MSEVSVNVKPDMYKFLISKEYITNKIDVNLYSYPVKPSLNYIHYNYNAQLIIKLM